MALKHLVDIAGSLVDISAYAPRLSWTARLNAEEGSVGSWEVKIDDPAGELEIVGHRRYFIEDDESEDEDDIIFGGFTGSVTISRLASTARRKVGSNARILTVMLVDANSVLSRVVMKGADTDRTVDAVGVETDVERMQWLLGTAEASIFDDVTTFVFIGAPVAMDGTLYRGTYFGQIVSDCSQQSGKNFYAWYRKVSGTRTLFIWYGKDSLPDYESPFLITNDRADIDQVAVDDGTATVWPLANDANLVKGYDRQYCGNYFTWGGPEPGATYQHNATTHAASAHRDMVTNAPLLRTKEKAQARAIRQLADVSGADYRVTTRLEGIPQHRVTLCKAGMVLQVKGTHWAPDLPGWHSARIVAAQPRPRHAGRLWDIDLELVIGSPPEDFETDGPPAPNYGGNVFAGLQRSSGDAADQRGPLYFSGTYETPDAVPGWNTCPTTGPIAIDAPFVRIEDGGPGWDSITVSAPMIVRIHAEAQFVGVYIPDVAVVMNVRVNGTVVGSFSGTTAGAFPSVDLRDYHLDAGDVVSVDSAGSGASGGHGPDTIFWSNSGINVTFLHVVRGDFTNEDPAAFGP